MLTSIFILVLDLTKSLFYFLRMYITEKELALNQENIALNTDSAIFS